MAWKDNETRNAWARQRNANLTPEQREKRRQYERERYKNNPDVRKKQREASLAWLARNPPQYVKDSLRGYWLKNRYHITVEQYTEMLIKQGGHCALCPTTQGETKRRMCVDHDHVCCPGVQCCGKCIRGILCGNCNRKIGFLEELLREGTYVPNPGTWTEKALAYLASYAKVCVSP
jgi:Recombination endonuclease VII